MIKLADILKEAQSNLKQQALEYLNTRKKAFTRGTSDHNITLKIINDITSMQNDTDIVPYLKQYTAVSTPKLVRDPATGQLTTDPSAPKVKKYSYGLKYMLAPLVKQLSSEQPKAESTEPHDPDSPEGPLGNTEDWKTKQSLAKVKQLEEEQKPSEELFNQAADFVAVYQEAPVFADGEVLVSGVGHLPGHMLEVSRAVGGNPVGHPVDVVAFG